MATFAPRPAENSDPWYGARETYDQSLEAAIAANETALAGKVPTTRTVAGKALTSDVTLVKGDVGLGNVDNTSDTAKPVSTATQTALDAKLATADAPELIRDTMGAALVAGSNITITPDDAADTITIAAGGGGWKRLSANHYYTTKGTLRPSSAGWVAVPVGTIYFAPVLVPEAITITRVGIDVRTATTAGHARLGVFTADLPSPATMTLVHDCGVVDTTATGQRVISGLSVVVPPGMYWVGVICDVATELQGVNGDAWTGNSVSGTDAAIGLRKAGETYGALAATYVASDYGGAIHHAGIG